LRQVLHLDHQVEVAEPRRCEAELAARQPPGLDQALLLEVTHVGGDILGERDVAGAGFEVAPRVVDIQPRLLQLFWPDAITAAIGTAIPSALR
jgi:hypothetical protein